MGEGEMRGEVPAWAAFTSSKTMEEKHICECSLQTCCLWGDYGTHKGCIEWTNGHKGLEPKRDLSQRFRLGTCQCTVATTFSLVTKMWPCLRDLLKPQPLHEAAFLPPAPVRDVSLNFTACTVSPRYLGRGRRGQSDRCNRQTLSLVAY